ncbi:MAG: ABC transporter ATP-binding protein, partial [Clostridia bacterium]|nr:ABC transporter ATP-binding protein [Clostridia bacterium]
MFSRFIPYFKRHKATLIIDLFCAALTTLCELFLPMIVREITETVTEGGNLTLTLIFGCTAFYLALRIIDTAANYYMATYGHIMGTKIESEMRYDFFAHLQKLSFSYYDNAKVGTLMSRITSDLFDITEFAHHCPEEFFIAGIKIVCSFIILCNMNLALTLIIFAVIPPSVLVLSIFRKKMKTGFRESRKQVGELNAAVEDSLLGIRIVKSFAKEEFEKDKFDKSNSKFLDIKSKVYKIMGAFQSFTRLFDGIMYIVVVAAGALFLYFKQISAADYIAYLMFVTTLTTSVRRLV